MKRLKYMMPLLAFVIAVTVAFAVPVEVEADKTEVSGTQEVDAWYEDPNTLECLECELYQYDCDVNGIGTICTCYVFYENGQVGEFDARNDPNDPDSSLRCNLLFRWN